jgi:lipid A biosynthesis lauroyl/palmitoleoyl acyltransferase
MSDQPHATGIATENPTEALPRRFLKPRYWGVWIGMGLMWSLLLLPQSWRVAIGARLGDLFYLLSKRARHAAERNIEMCFPELNGWLRQELLRRHFRAFGSATMSVSLIWWASAPRLRSLVRFRNREHYDRALAAGKKIILLAPHFLGLEVAGVFLAHERRLVSMYKQPHNDLVDWLMRRSRLRFGGALFERDSNLKGLVRLIRAGYPFYYLPDQNPGEASHVFAPFFGIPTATLTALSRLARLGGATVIPCFTRLLPQGDGYEIIFYAPLSGFPSGDDSTDAAHMNAAIEAGVREMPEQYMWTYKRFKQRPPDEPSLYV